MQTKTIGNNGPSRRAFILGAASFGGLALGGCSAMIGGRQLTVPNLLPAIISPYYLQIYRAMPEEKFPVPAVDLNKVGQAFLRTEVDDPTGERPGTIVVETSQRYLYLVQGGGRAIRYGVGIGRDGFTWSGRGSIGRKAQWPTWYPPQSMMERQPETREFAGGMPGGMNNPLGARAMYIYRGGVDTIYPHPRHARVLEHRQGGVVGLRATDQPGRDRPVFAGFGRHADYRARLISPPGASSWPWGPDSSSCP